MTDFEDWTLSQVADDFGDQYQSGQGTVTYINEAGVPESTVAAVRASADVANAMEQWSRNMQSSMGGSGKSRPSYDLFSRSRYSGENNIFRVMEMCAAAVENDDILSTLADTSEGIALQKMSFELQDEDQQDVWNQIAADLDLDARLREMWRELFKVSQFYMAMEWDWKDYTVRTKKSVLKKKGKGNRNRKKTFRLYCPTALSVLDPLKVVPVGTMMFNRERFAYIADRSENEGIASAMRGEVVDDMVLRLIESKYVPDKAEASKLADLGVPTQNLWLMKKHSVFRHTMTKAQYERFAIPRLKAVLPLLDMKQHLRESDRSALVGNTNFIVVIRKGTDKHPAKQRELESLQEQARVVARIPVIVGDHRLSVDIVAPKMDHTLDERRYHVIDSRLAFKALQSFAPASSSGGGLSGSSQVKEVSHLISRGFENRRHQLGRSLEKFVFKATVELNEELDETPSLIYNPRRISLDVNQDVLNAVLKLRDRGDLSRHTTLEELEYDQDVEAIRVVREEEEYGDVFNSHVPYDSPDAGKGKAPNDVEGGRPVGSKDDDGEGD